MVSRAVVVTGAAGGIGWATASLYAKDGAKLILADLLPEEIAAAIRFLASPDASFISGVSLAVDGGRLAQL